MRLATTWLLVLGAAAAVCAEGEKGRMAANEGSAVASLKQIVSTEGVWRQTDSDRNGAQDYWTRDVAGYYHVQDANGQKLKYIDVNMAKADRLGLGAYTDIAPTPKHGYWLRAMASDEAGKPYVDETLSAPYAPPVEHKPSTNASKYGYCAYPEQYGVTGTHTFIVNEEGVVYAKDLGHDAKEGCDAWPDLDPTTKGWSDSEAVEDAVRPPEMSADANETSACSALKQLVSTEGVWRQTDSDRNGAQDYWTRDVAGFYYLEDAAGQLLKYIDVRMAKADRSGLATYSKDPPMPKKGYWLCVMRADEAGTPYIDEALPAPGAKPVLDRPSTNSGKYAFCAYPAEYGVTGVKTFIVNEEGVVYEKDLGPDAKEGCETWPDADPSVQGWVASE